MDYFKAAAALESSKSDILCVEFWGNKVASDFL